jgi:hypothetical protein
VQLLLAREGHGLGRLDALAQPVAAVAVGDVHVLCVFVVVFWWCCGVLVVLVLVVGVVGWVEKF